MILPYMHSFYSVKTEQVYIIIFKQLESITGKQGQEKATTVCEDVENQEYRNKFFGEGKRWEPAALR